MDKLSRQINNNNNKINDHNNNNKIVISLHIEEWTMNKDDVEIKEYDAFVKRYIKDDTWPELSLVEPDYCK